MKNEKLFHNISIDSLLQYLFMKYFSKILLDESGSVVFFFSYCLQLQESQHSTDLVERDHDVEAGLGGDGMGVLQH